MTTLTERLRELENSKGLTDSVILAQELHALLVECGMALDWMTENVGRANPWTQEARQVLTKLKQAGIV